MNVLNMGADQDSVYTNGDSLPYLEDIQEVLCPA